MKNLINKGVFCLFFILSGFVNSQTQTPFPCSSGALFNNDVIIVPSTDAINLQDTRNRTIEFWFKPEDVTTRQVLYEEGAQVNALYFFLEAGRIYLGAYRNIAIFSANRRFFRSDAIIETDKWYHVALTLEDSSGLTLRWYLNGVLQDEQPGLQVNNHLGDISLAKSGDKLRFPSSLVSNWSANSQGVPGSQTYNNTFTASDPNPYNFTGNIALFRIWNIARTEVDIDNNKSTLLTSGTELVAYLDEDTIFYIPDGGTSISSSISLNEKIEKISIPNTDAINDQDTSNRTIEFRFKANNMDQRQVLYEEGGGVNAFTFFIDSGRLYLGAYRSNANIDADRRFFRSGVGAVVVNQEYHVAITLDNATTLKWFLDGVEQDSQAGLVVNTHTGDINIGESGGNLRYPSSLTSNWSPVSGSQTYNSETSTDNSSNEFLGDISLFRIWNTPRTEADILANLNTFLNSGTDLVAYQKVNQVFYTPTGGSSNTEVVDAVTTVLNYIWDGSGSSDWSSSTNWVNGTTPDLSRTQQVTIQDGGTDPILTTAINVGSLTIDSGVDLVVNSGATLNVYYNFNNNGTVTVKDGGSLIYHNCYSTIKGTGTFDVQRNTPVYDDNNFYSYWSSPVTETEANIGTIFPDADEMYTFNASTNPADWSSAVGANMIAGVGYAIQNEGLGGQLRTFSGPINEGSIVVTTYFNTNVASTDPSNVWSTEGDNLVGNPYASAIDWDKVIADSDNTNINGTIYYWNQNTAEVGDNNVADYLQYNTTGGGDAGVTGNIGSGQAFFIRTTDNGTITFKPTHQINANNTVFYRETVANSNISYNNKKHNRSWFTFSRGNKVNTLLVGFLEGATNQFDWLYDGPFDINETSMGFYSLVKRKYKASIQGLPPLKRDKKVVRLGFAVDKIGEHTIAIQEEHIDPDYHIYLRDREKKVTVDLRQRSYTFTIDSVGENNTRFKLIYTKKKRKTITNSNEDDPTVRELDSKDFSVYVDEVKDLIIEYDYDQDNIKQAFLYNIRGQRIKSFDRKSNNNVADLKTGIYIIEAFLFDNRKLIKKLVIAN